MEKSKQPTNQPAKRKYTHSFHWFYSVWLPLEIILNAVNENKQEEKQQFAYRNAIRLNTLPCILWDPLWLKLNILIHLTYIPILFDIFVLSVCLHASSMSACVRKLENAKSNVYFCVRMPFACSPAYGIRKLEIFERNQCYFGIERAERIICVCVYTYSGTLCTLTMMTTMTNVTDFPYHFDYYN